MTLKGKQNHYNIKFLKGHGLSISALNKLPKLEDHAVQNALADISDQAESIQVTVASILATGPPTTPP